MSSCTVEWPGHSAFVLVCQAAVPAPAMVDAPDDPDLIMQDRGLLFSDSVIFW